MIKDILKKYKNLSLNELLNDSRMKKMFYEILEEKKSEEKDIYKKIDNQKKWSQKDKASLIDIVEKIKDDEYIFSVSDIDNLNKFTNKINYIFRCNNRINLFNDSNCRLEELFNTMKKYDYPQAKENLESIIKDPTLDKPFPHLYSIIKYIQKPNFYPVYFPLGKNIHKYVILKEIKEDYEYCDFVDFYRNFNKSVNLTEETGIQFSAFIHTIRNRIMEEIENSDKSITEEDIRQLKKIYQHKNDKDFLESLKENMSGSEAKRDKNTVAWFVGAVIEGKDRIQEFIDEGIWINGYENEYIDYVNSIKVGDKIAIKSTYTRKHDLPFDNKDKMVSVMGIKAIGIVTHNFNDGHKISVEWELLDDIKEWYFFTSRKTIWKVDEKEGWMYKNLIDFTFNDAEQDIDRFLKDPYWEEKYVNSSKRQFEWTEFYEAAAKALLKYKDNRIELINIIHNMYDKLNMHNPLTEKGLEGKREPLTDICPFTVFGLFNKGITDENRRLIIEEIANILEVEESIPTSFEGIPILNNIQAWFFGDRNDREARDIENLWDLFEYAIYLAENYTEVNKDNFINIYDKVINQYGIKWNITFGLYWIKPWDYLTLDNNTRRALTEKLKIEVPRNSKKKICAGKEYIELIELLKEKFKEEDYPVHSFPELSHKAWSGEIKDKNISVSTDEMQSHYDYKSYTKADFLSEVFMEEKAYETLKALLARKKNLILQGPPGVGKTFAAKRLAYSLMGRKDSSRIEMLQFHQSYSYEDFIMGYRPSETGFELKEGPFYKFCQTASQNPDDNYYFIIDEINRANISKVFGELMMLIESDKRGEELKLAYSDNLFYIPENLYIIGMMNTADRSLAIIDYALRRRFSFFDLEPAFGTEAFREYLLEKGASEELVNRIRMKIGNINLEIKKDINLGKGFVIGHSYFCDYRDSENWYEEIIKYEIEPLIREYWFDEEEKAKSYTEDLLR